MNEIIIDGKKIKTVKCGKCGFLIDFHVEDNDMIIDECERCQSYNDDCIFHLQERDD